MNEDNKGLMTEAALKEVVKEKKKKIKTAKRLLTLAKLGMPLAFFIGIIAMALSLPEDAIDVMLWPYVIIFLVIEVILLVVPRSIQVREEVALKGLLSKSVIPMALSNIFQDVQYNRHASVDKELVKNTDMGVSFRDISRVYGNDWVKARYKNMTVEFSDIVMTHHVHVIDPVNTAHEAKVFEGTWLICDFKKRLAAEVLVCENYMNKNPFRNTILTENEEFNKRFTVRSDQPEEAFYVLTPHMMNFILELDNRARGKTYLRFLKDGRVCIAINSGKNLFELDMLTSQDYEVLKQQILDEVQYIVDILDALKAAGTMFEKQA